MFIVFDNLIFSKFTFPAFSPKNQTFDKDSKLSFEQFYIEQNLDKYPCMTFKCPFATIKKCQEEVQDRVNRKMKYFQKTDLTRFSINVIIFVLAATRI